MFIVDEDGNITMHAGDTGAIKVYAKRETGTEWTSADRLVFTVASSSGNVVLQRYYRLDTSLGNGYANIEFRNSDTDTLSPGTYHVERRYVVSALWDGTAPTDNVINALESSSHIVDGSIVRTADNTQQTLTISIVYGVV